MRDLFLYVFGDFEYVSDRHIFGVEHICLLVGTILLAVILCAIYRKKSIEKREKFARGLATFLIFCYLGDFFIQPFWAGELVLDRLPFQICLTMTVLISFATFNKKLAFLKQYFAVYSFFCSLIFMILPMGRFELDIRLYSYQFAQSWILHMGVFLWGAFEIFAGLVELRLKNFVRCYLGIVAIGFWGLFGCEIYDHNYMFFRTEYGFFPAKYNVYAFAAMAFLLILGMYAISEMIHKKREKTNKN